MLYFRLPSIPKTPDSYLCLDISPALFFVVTTEDSAIFASRYEA